MTRGVGSTLVGFFCAALLFAAEPPAGTRIIHPKDGALMVYVPAGEFVMGMDKADADKVAIDLGYKTAEDLWAWDCYPKRRVTIDGYFIDVHEVTFERWLKFRPSTNTHAEIEMPVGSIRWADAKAYAVSVGKSLPTDAQWEKAARGSDGRYYPWGNEAPTAERGNFGPKGSLATGPAKVGSFPKGASPYGVLDMLGNQYEWTSELLKAYPGNPLSEKMAGYGEDACLRGGSWYHGWIGFYAAKRFGLPQSETHHHIGFRTVWVPPAGYFESAEFKRDQVAP